MTTAEAATDYTHLTPHPERFAFIADTPESMTETGLHLPDASKELSVTGTIVAVGTECAARGLGIGQRVYVPKYAGDELNIEGKDIRFLHYDDMISVIGDSVKAKAVRRG